MTTKSRKINVFGGVERGRCLGLTTLPPSVSRLSRQCGSLNISQPHRPAWPVTGIVLLYFFTLEFDAASATTTLSLSGSSEEKAIIHQSPALRHAVSVFTCGRLGGSPSLGSTFGDAGNVTREAGGRAVVQVLVLTRWHPERRTSAPHPDVPAPHNEAPL
jgi:hypothetical protein